MAWTELRRIIDAYRNSDGPFALATLVKSLGSTFRQPGARMLIVPGQQYMIDDRKPILVRANYRLTDAVPGTVLGERSETEHEEMFLEQIRPPFRLILFGDYSDAEAVAQIAGLLGWQVEFALDADLLPAGDARTACVIMSHHFGRDMVAVRSALKRGFGYVGLLGPRRRKNLLLGEMIDEGCALDNISALHSPAGLDIGSEAPEEIALAVVAEIQATLMGRKGGPLRDRKGAIHKGGEPLLCNEMR
jgi:xanthine/CO dehydrogenase XdhC/CoxF family maturation factor